MLTLRRVKSLPVQDPGTPDHRSPARYLIWLTRTQARSVAAGATLGVIWMLSQALMPGVIGRAILRGAVVIQMLHHAPARGHIQHLTATANAKNRQIHDERLAA